MDKIAIFQEELDRILRPDVKNFTKLCIMQAPDYIFNNCPSGTCERFNPKDEMSADGLVIHTKRVFILAYELCRAYNCEENKDLILSACVLHDLVKQGWEKSGDTLKNHPELAVNLVDSVYKDVPGVIDEKSFFIIRGCIGYHYGQWSTSPWKKPLHKYSPEEMVVYIADFTASRNFLIVNHRR